MNKLYKLYKTIGDTMSVTTIQIDKELHKRLRIIAAHADKKLYEIIEDAATTLEEKYHIPQNTSEVEHE